MVDYLLHVGFGVRHLLNRLLHGQPTQDAEHVLQGPLGFPWPQIFPSRLRVRLFVTLGEIPQAHQALHEPYPWGQFFYALPTKMSWSLTVHHLLAVLEHRFD